MYGRRPVLTIYYTLQNSSPAATLNCTGAKCFKTWHSFRSWVHSIIRMLLRFQEAYAIRILISRETEMLGPLELYFSPCAIICSFFPFFPGTWNLFSQFSFVATQSSSTGFSCCCSKCGEWYYTSRGKKERYVLIFPKLNNHDICVTTPLEKHVCMQKGLFSECSWYGGEK